MFGALPHAQGAQAEAVMRRFAFLLCFVAFPSLALSAEIVRLPSREGVTQSFLLFHQGERPQALALLFPGGDGLLRIRGGGSTLRGVWASAVVAVPAVQASARATCVGSVRYGFVCLRGVSR